MKRANVLNALIAWEGLEKKTIAKKAGMSLNDIFTVLCSKYKPDEFEKIVNAINELAPKRESPLQKGLLKQMRETDANEVVEMAFVIAIEKEYTQRMKKEGRRNDRRQKKHIEVEHKQESIKRKRENMIIPEDVLEKLDISQRDKYVCRERAKGRTLEEIGKDLLITRERVRQIQAMALRKGHCLSTIKETERSELEIDRLKISVRAYNALARAGIHTIGEIKKMSFADITSIRNVGTKTAIEIFNAACDPKTHQKDTSFTPSQDVLMVL